VIVRGVGAVPATVSPAEARLVEQVVDSARYPLSEPESPAWKELVARVQHDLQHFGCCVLADFIRPSLKETLRQEGAEIAPLAHYDVEVVNAYNIASDTSLPDSHPGSIRMERGNAFVAWDKIPAGFIVHQLYTSQLLQRFLADCVKLPAIYPLADPLAGLCLNVIPPGMAHPWHFDTNEFAVSILTQEPQYGGVFEHCPNIRSTRAENFTDVRDVLNGRRDDLIFGLTLRPGDLQLFKGRFSLHRVAAVQGGTARHSAIFAYSERPGVVGSVVRTQQLFGRVLSEHLAGEGRAVRGDQLLD
jgi:hypothetical protein